jgi:hypothetical protein
MLWSFKAIFSRRRRRAAVAKVIPTPVKSENEKVEQLWLEQSDALEHLRKSTHHAEEALYELKRGEDAADRTKRLQKDCAIRRAELAVIVARRRQRYVETRVAALARRWHAHTLLECALVITDSLANEHMSALLGEYCKFMKIIGGLEAQARRGA